MNQSDTLNIAAAGFGLCLLAMLALLVQLRRGPRWGVVAWSMAVALCVSAAWSACGLAFAVDPGPWRWAALRWSDLLRSAAWSAFVLALLFERQSGRPDRGEGGRFLPWVVFGLIASVGVGGLWPAPGQGLEDLGTLKVGFMASLVLAILGLVCIEQLLRNVPARQRWSIWPLAVALGGHFAFDLYVYSDAVLLGRLDFVAWSVQGGVLACAAPFLGIATARNRVWTKHLVLSHNVAFQSTVLLASAVYLLAVAALGYLVRLYGGAWGPALQVILFAAALMVMGVLLTLGTFRSKLRVLVSKNLLERRYDYREEWQRFTRLLSVRHESADIHVRCIEALADLVEGTAGTIWIRREGGFRQVAQWNAPQLGAVEPDDSELVAFLSRTGWVIDLQEYRRDAQRYEGLKLPSWLEASAAARLVVPLITAEGVIGFVVLMSPRVQIEVNWEVLDLLKTAGSEVAVLLRQIEINQSLIEAEKFAAVTRASAFMVHDLKNLVAQLSLMLKNAERHGDNPEFRRDMLDTVRHVAERLSNLLLQARLSTRPVQNPQAVDAAAIVRRVCESKVAQRSGLSWHADGPVMAIAHPDRLEHVLAHVVQNAIDATIPAGIIRVSIEQRDARVVFRIEDDGVGIAPDFLQKRLFRPFQTTKESGMGIGVYESHQYVSSLGGAMTIDSQRDAGTRVCIELPAALPGRIADLHSERAV